MRARAGTTMVDVLFMLLIISLAVIPSAAVMLYVQQNARTIRQKEAALFLARQEVARLHSNFDVMSLAPYTGPPPQAPAAPPYAAPVLDTIVYTVVDETQPVVGEPNMVDVAVTVTYGGALVPVIYVARIFRDVQEMESP